MCSPLNINIASSTENGKSARTETTAAEVSEPPRLSAKPLLAGTEFKDLKQKLRQNKDGRLGMGNDDWMFLFTWK